MLTRIMGFSMFASFLQTDSYASSSFKLLVLGTLVEVGRRFCQWVYDRFNIFRESFDMQLGMRLTVHFLVSLKNIRLPPSLTRATPYMNG